MVILLIFMQRSSRCEGFASSDSGSRQLVRKSLARSLESPECRLLITQIATSSYGPLETLSRNRRSYLLIFNQMSTQFNLWMLLC